MAEEDSRGPNEEGYEGDEAYYEEGHEEEGLYEGHDDDEEEDYYQEHEHHDEEEDYSQQHHQSHYDDDDEEGLYEQDEQEDEEDEEDQQEAHFGGHDDEEEEEDEEEEDGFNAEMQAQEEMKKMQERIRPKQGRELIIDERYSQILDDINSIRKKNKMPPLWEHKYMNKAAEEYASYRFPEELVPLEEEKNLMPSIMQRLFPDQADKHTYICVKYRFPEQDSDGRPRGTPSSQDMLFIGDEINEMFKECTEDKMKILNPEYNSVSIFVDYNDHQLIIVIIISQAVAGITKIKSSDKGIDVHGQIWSELPNVSAWGAFKAKLIYEEKESEGQDPSACIAAEIMHNKIENNKDTQEFICHFEIAELIVEPPKKILIFFVKNLAAIKNMRSSKIKEDKFNQFITFPCIEYPKERLQEEELNRKFLAEQKKLQRLKEEEERRRKEEEHRRIIKEMEMQHKNEDEDEHEDADNSEEEEEEEQVSEVSDSMEDEDFMGAQPKQITNKMIRMELEKAIEEASRECDNFERENLFLQAEIIALNKDKKKSSDRANEFNMSDVKYANTLARVHQIRQELKSTHDRYSKMTHDLKLKLEEKISKCNDIKTTFINLKREVSKKAAYSKTDKPIPEKEIFEWEQQEAAMSRDIQKLRLDNLKLKTNLLKQEKEMKKKEELAEGLHLIDFEQLKIENQSLNEKIEERNEDLHKLKKKNTTTVQILTHTVEKLNHIKEQNSKLDEINGSLNRVSKIKKLELDKAKESFEKQDRILVSLNQKTGIVNNEELKDDFTKRNERNKMYEEKIGRRKAIHDEMVRVIEVFKKDKRESPHLYH